MSEESETRNHECPKCGAPIDGASPKGLCPACLMAGAMEATQPFTEDTEKSPDPLPDIEVIREAFPQLEIIELIGAGGMGIVYKARQISLDREVALKFLAPGHSHDSGFAERFTREARALAAMNHPNIVTIHDFGEADGFYYLIMEYVDGVNLRQAMDKGKLSPKQAMTIVPAICDALEYAHQQGVIHRDIKPENLLLDRLGNIKVADFGIARIIHSNQSDAGPTPNHLNDDPGLTGSKLGTPNYMSPEQAKSPGEVDHRADIYSLGVVIYEMLTGERPGDSIHPPSSKVEIDVRLDEVVLRALSASPEMRWQSVNELKTRIETIESTDEAAESTDSSHWWKYAAGLVTIALAIAAFAALFSEKKEKITPPASLIETTSSPSEDDPSAVWYRAFLAFEAALELKKQNRYPEALTKCEEALSLYNELTRKHSEFQPEIVKYKQKIVSDARFKLVDLSRLNLEYTPPTFPITPYQRITTPSLPSTGADIDPRLFPKPPPINYNPPPNFPAPGPNDPPLKNIPDLVDAYLRAPDWKARLPYILHGRTLKEQIAAYYQNSPDFSLSRFKMKLFQLELEPEYGGPFWVYQITRGDSDENGVPMLIQVENGNLKVNWQAYTEFSDQHLLKYINGQITGPRDFRLVAERQSPDSQPNGLASRYEEEYDCYRINPPDENNLTNPEYAFVKKGTGIAKKMAEKISPGDPPLAVTLTLDKKKLNDGETRYMITNLVNEGWF